MKHFSSKRDLIVIIFFLFLSNSNYLLAQDERIKEYNQKIRKYSSQPDSIIHYGNLLTQLKSSQAKYEGFYAIGYSYYRRENIDSSLLYFRKAKNTLSTNQYSERCRVTRMMAISNIKIGELDSAFALVDELYNISIEANDSICLASTYNTRGIIYKEKGLFNQAIENYVLASEIHKKINSFNLINSYTNIAIGYANLDQDELSLEWFKKAYESSKTFKSERLKIRSTINLGNHFRAMNLLDSSRFYLELLTIDSLQLELSQKAYVLEQLALISIESSENEQAEAYLQKLRKLLSNKDNNILLIEYYKAKTRLHKNQNLYEQALIHCDSGISITKEHNFNTRLVSFLYTKTELQELMNKPLLALNSLKEYNHLKDSLNKNKGMAAIQSVVSEFELAEKEKALLTLINENENNVFLTRTSIFTTIVLLLLTLFLYKKYNKNRILVIEPNSEKINENGIQNTTLENADYLTLKSKQVILKSDVLYIKSSGHYVMIYIDQKEKPYTERYAIAEIEKELSSPEFIRTHRSILVNAIKVKQILSNSIILSNNDEVPLSRYYKKILKNNSHSLFK